MEKYVIKVVHAVQGTMFFSRNELGDTWVTHEECASEFPSMMELTPVLDKIKVDFFEEKETFSKYFMEGSLVVVRSVYEEFPVKIF